MSAGHDFGPPSGGAAEADAEAEGAALAEAVGTKSDATGGGASALGFGGRLSGSGLLPEQAAPPKKRAAAPRATEPLKVEKIASFTRNRSSRVERRCGTRSDRSAAEELAEPLPLR